MLFDRIAEEKIMEALKRGVFSNLPGAGNPLPQDEPAIPEDLRMAYRMLKTADYLPPELALRKEIHSTRELLADTPDLAGKQRVMARLNLMIRKLNMLHPSRADREIPEYYLPRIVDHLENNRS